MRALKRQFVMVTGMLVTLLLLLPAALAGSNSLTQGAREMGCIIREPGSARFLRNDSADKKAIGEAAVNAHRLRGTKVIDPCLTGQVRNIPAAVYAALAEKYPEKFQPLDAEDQSVACEQLRVVRRMSHQSITILGSLRERHLKPYYLIPSH